MHDHHQNQSQSINGQLSFSAGDLFPRIIATFCATLAGTNRLVVNDRGGGSRFLSTLFSLFLSQRVVDLLPSSVFPPFPKDSVDRAPIGIVFRQHSSLASSRPDRQNGIDNSPPIDRSTASPDARWKQLPKNLPLPVRQIAGILLSAFHVIAPSSLSV